MKNLMPKEISDILVKVHSGKKATEEEQLMVQSYLGSLTYSARHPVTGHELPNPNPVEVDVSLNKPECLEDRIKRIMSVSSRIAAMNGFETAEEADDFDVEEVFERGPVSPFEMVDHFVDMTPEQPKPQPEVPAEEPPATSSEAEPDITAEP